MNEALLELLRICNGKTVQLATKVNGSAPEAVRPSGDFAVPDLYRLAWRYERCETHRQRLHLIKCVQGIATRIRYSPEPRLDAIRGTREWREKIARDERPAKVVAWVFGIRKATVLLYRREFGVVRKPGRPKRFRRRTSPIQFPNVTLG